MVIRKRKPNPRGKSRVHSIACHDDTWKKFEQFKHKHSLSADKMINVLIDSYNKKNLPYQLRYLKDLRGMIDKQIANLK